MKKIFLILMVFTLFITGCSKEDSKYIEEGKIAIANQEYEKALNLFTLAKEEKESDEEINSLYNQTKNLIEAIDSKENKNYDVAIQICITIKGMNSNTNIIKEAAQELNDECKELIKKDKENEEAENKKEKATTNSQPTKTATKIYYNTSKKRYYITRLSQVESRVEALQNSPEFNSGYMMDLRCIMGQCYVEWDDLLNEIYGVLKTQLSESEMNALRNKQRNWIKYRDNAANKAMTEYQGGTMGYLEHSTVSAELTRQRCYELVDFYMY